MRIPRMRSFHQRLILSGATALALLAPVVQSKVPGSMTRKKFVADISTASAGQRPPSLPATVEFNLGIQQTGGFRCYINVEALTVPPQ